MELEGDCVFTLSLVCSFVCLSISKITQKVMDGFERNFHDSLTFETGNSGLDFGEDTVIESSVLEFPPSINLQH